VSTPTSIIDINDNRYDAATGQIINTVKKASQKSSQVIDGFIKRPQQLSAKTSGRHTTSRTAARKVKSAELHARAQKAQTLMRGGLKNPAERFQSRLQHLTSEPRPETQLRAKTTSKHAQVKRFGNPLASNRFRQPAKISEEALSGEVVNRGTSRSNSAMPATAPMPSMIASASHQKLERLLDEALTQADAHKEALRYQAARHFWQRRWFSGPKRWILVAAVLLLASGGAIYAWQTVPQLSVKVAGIRAHLTPVVPSYKPDGYRASPAKSISGAVAISYQSTADPAQQYQITQSQSNLTSTSVAQSVVPKGAAVQTSQVQGNTVYIYGSHNDAAWVNNGVLYTISDKANLSSDQLIKIVQSLNP
jgi:hypothetical protein